MAFKPVKMNNNWEYITYKVGSTPIDEKKSGTVMVKWPNGRIHIARFVSVKYYASYSDHGHRHDVTGHKLVISAEHNGVPIQIPLQAVEIDPSTLEQEA
jgi:hypothetical protein